MNENEMYVGHSNTKIISNRKDTMKRQNNLRSHKVRSEFNERPFSSRISLMLFDVCSQYAYRSSFSLCTFFLWFFSFGLVLFTSIWHFFCRVNSFFCYWFFLLIYSADSVEICSCSFGCYFIYDTRIPFIPAFSV